METDEIDLRDIPEMMRGDYPQPRCPVCGRFARREQYSWRFGCIWPDGEGGWEHD